MKETRQTSPGRLGEAIMTKMLFTPRYQTVSAYKFDGQPDGVKTFRCTGPGNDLQKVPRNFEVMGASRAGLEQGGKMIPVSKDQWIVSLDGRMVVMNEEDFKNHYQELVIQNK